MKTIIPHNVLTISEMTKRPNRISAELIRLDELVLTDEVVKKLRASSSMFNKTTYVQIVCDGTRYNVESINRRKNGSFKIVLISPKSLMTLTGAADSNVKVVKDQVI